MPEGQAAPPAAAGAAGRQEDNGMRRIFNLVQPVILAFLLAQLVGKFFSPATNNQASPPVATEVRAPAPGQPDPLATPPTVAHLSPLFPLGTLVDIHFCLSVSPHGDNCSPNRARGPLPRVTWHNITFGDWKESRVVDFDVQMPPGVLRNHSMWADMLLTHAGASPDPRDPTFYRPKTVHIRKLMTRYLPKVKERKVKNLLNKMSEGSEDVQEEEPDVIVSHWHKNLTLALVSDAPPVPLDKLPVVVHPFIHLDQALRDATGTVGYYNPILFPNEFWHLKEQYIEINSTTPVLPLQVVFQPMSYFKFQMFASLTASFEQASQAQGMSTGAELDEIKRMLTDTNPWFLALTAAVSVLHMIFEMLAFTNDVSHWKNKKELVGVSLRTILTNVFVQIVVLLYLIDNNENTSWMIIMTSGMGAAIEAWKITKAVDIKLVAAPPGAIMPFKIQVTDKHVLSEDEKKTQEYDKLAFRYVTYVTIPLLGGYTIYSLLYESHRGWYSFVISTLTSFVYMFGFAQLIPQLIINYKLKSVAHMPMKAMIYKTLSTVVDDFFAFCIKMPILHRLACFRDDVVFCIFLYQRWIYRIDPKRINEYGQVMASDIDAASAKEQKHPNDKTQVASKAKARVESKKDQ